MIQKQKKYLNIALFFLFCFFGFLYFFIAENNNILTNWNYFGLFGVTAFFLIAFILVWSFNNVPKNHISIPSVLFLIVFGCFVYFGTFDHYFQSLAGSEFIYRGSLKAGYNYLIIGLSGWILGHLIGLFFVARNNINELSMCPNKHSKTLVWLQNRLRGFTLFWGIVGIASFIIFFAFHVKGIPFLNGTSPNANPLLRSLILGPAHNISVIAFNATTMALVFSGIYLIYYNEKKILVLIIYLASNLCFCLWGARIYMAIPFMALLMNYIYKSQYSLKKTFLVLVIIFVIGSIYGLVRNRTFYASHGTDFNKRTSVERIADLHIAPEFRDLIGCISYLDELRAEYKPSYYFYGILFTAVPKKILDVFGVDKDVLFSEDGIGVGWLAARTTRNVEWTAIRPGIIGQSLIALGIMGMFLTFVCLGFLFAILDWLSRFLYAKSAILPFIFLTAVIFSYAIIGATNSIFSKFWYLSYGYFFTCLFVTKKITYVDTKPN